jgi:hypothetical protein
MLSDEIVAHLTRDGRPAEREVIRYVGFGGDKTTAGDVDHQDVDHSTGGWPPEGTEGELDAAQRLIGWRNRQGEQWEPALLLPKSSSVQFRRRVRIRGGGRPGGRVFRR